MPLVLALAGCAPPDGDGLASRIADRVREGDGTTVDVSALSPFEWDRLHVVGPYHTPETFERETDIDWPLHWRWGHIDLLDDRVLLVFEKGGEAVAALEHHRQNGMIAPTCCDLPLYDSEPSGLRPDEAWFVVEVRDDRHFPALERLPATP